MAIDPDELRSLSASEKLRIVEMLWDDIGKSSEPLIVRDWQREEVARRREEMLRDPDLGLDHRQVWDRIRGNDG